MIYSYDYDHGYVPSMPTIEVAIGPAMAAPLITLRAIVDTGADATMIPEQHLQQIQADRCDQAWIRAVTDQRVKVDLYSISMQFGAFDQNYLEVVANTHTDEVILGRDVLNQLIVTLNGLATVVEVSS